MAIDIFSSSISTNLWTVPGSNSDLQSETLPTTRPGEGPEDEKYHHYIDANIENLHYLKRADSVVFLVCS